MTDRLQNILRIALLCGLILWGGHTFLEYISVNVHQAVLLSDADHQIISDACGGADLCTKLHSVLPFLTNTIARAGAFGWYVFWSVLIYAILLVLSFMKSGQWRMRLTLTPLKLILTFIGLLWVLTTVLGQGGSGDQPYRRVFMPNSQLYPTADPHTLQVLTDDYMLLKNRGCLTEVQSAAAGVEVSDVSYVCMQEAFVTRVLTEVVFILGLLLVLLSFGRAILQLFRLQTQSRKLEALLSVGLGACGLIVILWCLAVLGFYTSLAGWLLIVALLALCWKHALYWYNSLRETRWEYDAPWYGGALFLSWLLISYLLFNFLTVVRPFPIGWDDLGVYLNDPRLIVSYAGFIPRMSAFQWEYMTSLGFLLFGYDSWFGATTSMLINWMAGLLAVCTVYTFGALYFGRRQGLIAALMYYTLPMVGHFSFADMKVDNAVFTMGALCVLTVFLALFPVHEEGEPEEYASSNFPWMLIILAGIFGGFGFAMKPTTIMVVMSMFAVMIGSLLQVTAFVGGSFIAWTVFTYQGIFNVKDVLQRVIGNPQAISQSMVTVISLFLAAIFTGIGAWLKPSSVKRTFLACVLFLGVFVATISPWLMHNNIVAGNVIPKLLLRAPNRITPIFLLGGQAVPPGVNARTLPQDLKVDDMGPACVGGTSKSEELDRYWGYGTGIGHYLGLPWRVVMNADSAGYYVTTVPALLLFPLLLLLPYFWTKRGRWLRWMFVATLFMVMQWAFFANGILWYGIGMFLGLALGMEALVSKAPDRSTKTVASILIGLSLFVAFANRFWQFESQKNLYAYPLGVVSAEAMEERTIPHYNVIRNIVMQRAEQMPETPYVFRMGTFIPYFIPKNMEIIPVADNQLDLFTCMNQDRDAVMTVKRLKALGFNSIIFDTNTATIERDPNGSLHKKVQAFLDFANTPGLGLQAAVNDADGGIVFLLLP